MYILMVELRASPERLDELEPVLRALAETARTEPGIVCYAVQRREDSPDVFLLCEWYRDEAAWEMHMALAPVREALGRFDALLAAPPAVTRCAPVALACRPA
ncbi:putative quinol monooxygenase [Castellaniella defragrans]|uniref:Quinol monooxygenase YgiN n=1 Tax=Castellaniella defragrans TaxID=75697 RepID=A0A7W9TS47_CASDE|nr:putative quinol monooxygenase [Castellaniella defragrans]KAB0620585.1 antibiotic biosynthesis monooxygenase [Castellaniella defragrans]MBB6085396.1 quinol monooxygenase YgiN [Castellaniella defragrans]